ncbi:MAG: hypothetical protein [phage Lak_Megaphage_RVC_AP3_GC31]|nr:MAG: hypothetical protein [phage Lak_Megaphage_RVC_AP3_GC31]
MEYSYKETKYTTLSGKVLPCEVVDIEKYAEESGQTAENANAFLWSERFALRHNVHSILYPDYDVSIVEFMKTENDIDFNAVKNIKDVYDIVMDLAVKYAKWCNSVNPTRYPETLMRELENFCKGAIGEYVWFWFLKLNKKLRLSNNGHQTEYLFNNICLRKDDDIDEGVDCIGEVEIDGKGMHNCIFQFKFYDPNSSNEITLKLCQGVHDDGCNREFISHSHNEVNTFICWLGTDKNVSHWLERDGVLNNCVKFIDINTIKINNSEHILQKIVKKINDIKNLG